MTRINVTKLVESGLLFEINRSLLNPLGLTLELQRDPGNSGVPSDTLVLMGTDDSEGILFTESSFIDGASKFSLYMKKEGEARLVSRIKSTGFIRQTSSNQ